MRPRAESCLSSRDTRPARWRSHPTARSWRSRATHTNIIKLWNVTTGREQGTLKGHASRVYAAAFSPDGKRLATASNDSTVRVWDLATGQELVALKGHFTVVSSVAFSPDGKTLASGSGDLTVRLWRAATEQEVLARGKE